MRRFTLRRFPSIRSTTRQLVSAGATLGVLACAAGASAQDAVAVRTASGPLLPNVFPTVQLFQQDMGATLNGNLVGTQPSGRREIPWDALADADASPSSLPGDYYGGVLARGAVFSTPGTRFEASARTGNVSGTATLFANLNASYATEFAAYSGPRLFTPVGSNVVDVRFVVPGTTTPAVTRGFGAVFTDVDLVSTTTIEYFAGRKSLGTFSAPATGGSAQYSFLGVDFGTAVVTRVRITLGDTAIGPNDVSFGGAGDVVVLDDLVFGEPRSTQADLAVRVEASPASGVVGTAVTYRVFVDNGGAQRVVEPTCGFVLPNGATLLEAPTGCEVSQDGTTAECALLALDPGTSQVLEFRFEATALGDMDLAATVSATNEGPGDDNFAQALVPIQLDGCDEAPTVDSVRCRVASILELVGAAFPTGDLGTKLTKQLTKARDLADAAAAAVNDGNRKRAASRLKKAAGALGKAARLFPNPKFAPAGADVAAQLRGIARATADVQVDLAAVRDALRR